MALSIFLTLATVLYTPSLSQDIIGIIFSKVPREPITFPILPPDIKYFSVSVYINTFELFTLSLRYEYNSSSVIFGFFSIKS